MKPVILGTLMGLMMMWMLHGVLTGESTLAGWAMFGFISAHFAIALVVVLLGAKVAKLSPRFRTLLSHRPSVRHVASMAFGVILSGGLVHLYIHGGVI